MVATVVEAEGRMGHRVELEIGGNDQHVFQHGGALFGEIGDFDVQRGGGADGGDGHGVLVDVVGHLPLGAFLGILEGFVVAHVGVFGSEDGEGVDPGGEVVVVMAVDFALDFEPGGFDQEFGRRLVRVERGGGRGVRAVEDARDQGEERVGAEAAARAGAFFAGGVAEVGDERADVAGGQRRGEDYAVGVRGVGRVVFVGAAWRFFFLFFGGQSESLGRLPPIPEIGIEVFSERRVVFQLLHRHARHVLGGLRVERTGVGGSAQHSRTDAARDVEAEAESAAATERADRHPAGSRRHVEKDFFVVEMRLQEDNRLAIFSPIVYTRKFCKKYR